MQLVDRRPVGGLADGGVASGETLVGAVGHRPSTSCR
jgi:hypothetical protein